MRILHLIPEFNRGGTERIVINLARIQQSQGHDVQTFSFSSVNLYPDETKDLKITTFINSSVNYGFMRKPRHNLQDLQSAVFEFGPEIIHSHSYWTDLLIHAIPKTNAKYFSHLHLYYDEHAIKLSLNTTRIQSWLGMKMLHRAYQQRGTRFIAVSRSVESFYKKCLPPGLKSKISVLNNFLSFQPQPRTKRALESPIKLLSVGRLVPIKNQIFLIEALSELISSGLDIKLTIAGGGPEKELLEKKINELGLSDNVELSGIVSDTIRLYQSHDIYVHSALVEPFGLTVLEAMSQGLPCVALSADGVHDIIESNEQGLIVHNMDEFNSAIERLIFEQGYYCKISGGAFRRSQNFPLREYETNIMHLYSN